MCMRSNERYPPTALLTEGEFITPGQEAAFDAVDGIVLRQVMTTRATSSAPHAAFTALLKIRPTNRV